MAQTMVGSTAKELKFTEFHNIYATCRFCTQKFYVLEVFVRQNFGDLHKL